MKTGQSDQLSPGAQLKVRNPIRYQGGSDIEEGGFWLS